MTAVRSYEWTIAALETGVERKADIVCLQEPLREEERGGIRISHLAYEISKRKRVRTAIRRGSILVVDERTDLSRGAHEDAIATDVRRKGERIMRIVNVYDQRTRIRERDGRESWTGGESFGRGAPSSLETLTPIAYDGTQDAKCSGMLRYRKT